MASHNAHPMAIADLQSQSRWAIAKLEIVQRQKHKLKQELDKERQESASLKMAHDDLQNRRIQLGSLLDRRAKECSKYYSLYEKAQDETKAAIKAYECEKQGLEKDRKILSDQVADLRVDLDKRKITEDQINREYAQLQTNVEGCIASLPHTIPEDKQHYLQRISLPNRIDPAELGVTVEELNTWMLTSALLKHVIEAVQPKLYSFLTESLRSDFSQDTTGVGNALAIMERSIDAQLNDPTQDITSRKAGVRPSESRGPGTELCGMFYRWRADTTWLLYSMRSQPTEASKSSPLRNEAVESAMENFLLDLMRKPSTTQTRKGLDRGLTLDDDESDKYTENSVGWHMVESENLSATETSFPEAKQSRKTAGERSISRDETASASGIDAGLEQHAPMNRERIHSFIEKYTDWFTKHEYEIEVGSLGDPTNPIDSDHQLPKQDELEERKISTRPSKRDSVQSTQTWAREGHSRDGISFPEKETSKSHFLERQSGETNSERSLSTSMQRLELEQGSDVYDFSEALSILSTKEDDTDPMDIFRSSQDDDGAAKTRKRRFISQLDKCIVQAVHFLTRIRASRANYVLEWSPTGTRFRHEWMQAIPKTSRPERMQRFMTQEPVIRYCKYPALLKYGVDDGKHYEQVKCIKKAEVILPITQIPRYPGLKYDLNSPERVRGLKNPDEPRKNTKRLPSWMPL